MRKPSMSLVIGVLEREAKKPSTADRGDNQESKRR